ncbi:uncharacterized protein LOC143819831 [Paroedura picta]|uniref:uncharacterized protein LOC143819831 n=1 Tax=Paroedura picta TaxID=143630 RepID=UPI004057C67C
MNKGKSQQNYQTSLRRFSFAGKGDPGSQASQTRSDKMNVELNESLTTIKQILQTNTEAINQLSLNIKELTKKQGGLEETTKKIVEDLKEIKRRMDNNEQTVETIREEREKLEDQMAMLEYRQREHTLRFRGLPDKDKDDIDIRKFMIDGLAKLLNINAEYMEDQVDTVFWVNSVYAKQHKLPRDCLIQFTTRNIKDQILQEHYKTPFCVAGERIKILKEIPARLLRKRKDYNFLSTALKNKGIKYRWELPEGISFSYRGKKYKFTEQIKTQAFWRKYKKELIPDPDLDN